MATILIPLATIARQQGRDEECERLLHEAARVAEAGNRLSAVAVAQHQLALLHASRKRHRQAETLLRSSMALTTKEVGRENTQTVICMADLAATLAAQRKYAEAEVFLREAIGVVEKVRVASDSWLSQLLQRHAEVLRKLKRKDEAKAVASRAKALLEFGLVAKPGQTVDVLELQSKRR